jgi:hypothetical protein
VILKLTWAVFQKYLRPSSLSIMPYKKAVRFSWRSCANTTFPTSAEAPTWPTDGATLYLYYKYVLLGFHCVFSGLEDGARMCRKERKDVMNRDTIQNGSQS